MVAPSSVTLADYRSSLRRLLHDEGDTLFSLANKDAWINEAIQQRDIDTGGLRDQVTFVLTTSQDTYSFTDLSAGTFLVGTATANIHDVIAITLQYVGYRYVLENYSLTELNSIPGYRAYLNSTDRPQAWCRFGPNRFILAPSPSVAYTIEVDVVTYSPPTLLVALTDADPAPYPYTYPVPFYAAWLAAMNEARFDKADVMERRYAKAIDAVNSTRVGSVPSMYPGR